MSSSLLHSGANERKYLMLQKLGGKEALSEATDKFYDRQVRDERLLKFFHGTDLEILKWHQFNLMGIAFTSVPESFDARHLILKRHQKLFDEGLNETYFDVVIEHFTGTLQDMQVDQGVIDEALHVIMPLREIFAQGAKSANDRIRTLRRQRLINTGMTAVAVGGVIALLAYYSAKRLIRRR